MSTLDEHLYAVERYGYDRTKFPLYYRDHRITILQNDAHFDHDDRLRYDLELYCTNCGLGSGRSSRTPVDCPNEMAYVVAVKLAVIGEFAVVEC